MKPGNNFHKAWLWVPTLYFLQGIPYIIVNNVSVVFYKRMGLSNSEIAFYTSWLYLPWVLKPLWSPIVDLIKTKHQWIVVLQIAISCSLGLLGFFIPASFWFQISLCLFWIVAFSSSTHDIAADGFYMLSLDENQQSFFVGIRSTFYRIAMITGQGVMIMIAGTFESSSAIGSKVTAEAWATTFYLAALLFALITLYHTMFLPYSKKDISKSINFKQLKNEFLKTFQAFFKKTGILWALLFLLIYRFGEAQLLKIAPLFLMDKRSVGGLELTTEKVGFVFGTVGVISLIIGGVSGGIAVSKKGLKYWLWWMFLAINIPHLLYLLLAIYQPSNFIIINICAAIEQFGYGFGFTAYMIFMLYLAEGEYKTVHYSLCTGFMALSMMIPGLFSGKLQELIGYKMFFGWILLAMIPGIWILRKVSLERDFGKN